MASRRARDLHAGDIISIREISNPNDPTEVVHEWSDIVIIEPMPEAYRVHTADGIIVLEGNEVVEVYEDEAG